MSAATAKKGEDRSALLRAYLAIQELEAKLERAEAARREPIAVVGLGCRFPGAEDPAAFWDLLRNGRDATGEVPPGRWDVDAFYDPEPQAPGKAYTRRGGYLRDVAGFDPEFFGVSPREAAGMDPQQRLLLEVAWEALEHAGIAPDRLAASSTGVFVGVMNLDYPQMLLTAADPGRIDAFFGAGSEASFPAGRLSYHLGLRGPSMVVATACSSSLVAVHLACQSLRLGECRLALAGGVNVILNPRANVVLCKMSALSPDGRCKAFDARADGYGRGEGCGVVVLKRLSDAQADGDNVLAVVRGSAVNHGGPSGGLTVPSGPAQEAVIRDALRAAGVDPARVGYVEAHGTGTALGDPIELRALAAVLGPGRAEGDRFLVGSVKTNVGHLESAAGVAGLIKVVLALRHREVPPHLHLERPNPHVPWDELPAVVPTRPAPWPPLFGPSPSEGEGTKRGEAPRLAGVSSFGLSGINAHLVVEEAPPGEAPEAPGRPYHLLGLSARNGAALRELAARWERHLAAHPGESLADAAFTANTGRAAFRHRLAVVAEGPAGARAALAAFAAGRPDPAVRAGEAAGDGPPRVAFLFAGLGAQYVGLGRQLHDTQATFREALDQCAAAAAPHLEQSLLSVLYPPPGALSLLEEPLCAQPALFALEYALARLWLSWGVRPAAVLGHGVGEYAAACVAGVLPLDDALRLVVARARLVQGLAHESATAAVFAAEERVAAAIVPYADRVALAAVNGPEQVLVSGDRRAVQAVLTALERVGVASEMLRGAQPLPSPALEPGLDAFEEAARTAALAPPRLALVSGMTGKPAGDELVDPSYWRRQAARPVRFADGVRSLREQGCEVFVEVGPAPALSALARRGEPACPWLASLRPERDDGLQLLETLQALWVRGVPVDWAAFYAGPPRRKLSLPTYPYQRQRCWHEDLEPGRVGPGIVPGAPATRTLLGRRLRSALREKVFEAVWGAATPALLGDHRVDGEAVAPAAGFVAAALGAARDVLGRGPCDLEGLAFPEAMLLPGGGRVVQLVLAPREADLWDFALHGQACDDPDGPWSLHATGQVRSRGALLGGVVESVAALDVVRDRCPRQVAPAEFYRSLTRIGLDLGPHFRWLEEVRGGEGEALGRLRSPGEDDTAVALLPPGLLDGCFQLVAAALPPDGMRGAYVPLGVDRLRFDALSPDAGALWCHAVLRPGEGAGETIAADVRLFEVSGRPVASVEGLRLKRVEPGALVRGGTGRPEDWLYELRWERVSPPSVPSGGDGLGTWLILADRAGTGEALADALRSRGARCVVEPPRDGLDEPGAEPDLDRLLAGAGGPLRGVVHLWGLDASDGESWDVAQRRVCGSALSLIQGLVRRGGDLPVVWLVTRGAQGVGGEVVSPAQATVWGLARTAAREHPELRCACVDLDPEAGPRDVDALLPEVCAPDGEDQIAWRGGARYAARLARADLAGVGEQPVRLEQAAPGVLDSLALRPMTRRPPEPGEVEVRVRAAGLNFRDVLGALGMYPGDAGPPGGECAGTVVAVGEGVEGLAPGQDVVALAPGSLSSFVTVRAELVAPKPANLTFEEAASVPVAFLTARMALEGLAGLREGERVLVHAASGGVGLAAVQLARRAGAEVFATAGSPAKRAFLQARGIEHVFDSRSLAFADEVRAATGGEGVHVVLNSLAGEFIRKGLEVLAAGGRFVEIGKTDVWEPERVREVRDDVAYHVFALDRMTREEPARVGVELRRLLDVLSQDAAGTLMPLPRQVFPLHDAGRAFRFMAQARHTGKIVIAVGEPSPTVSADGTYLITGGLGALGMHVARWLVGQGARHLMLVGRRGASPEAALVIRELEGAGARVLVARADVTEHDELGKVLAELRDSWPPLRGVVHAAGVLDDGVLVEQSWQRFERVLAPKVAGAWNLHQLTRDTPLDFFVLFSSAASLLGSPGQANYASANAFLDALAHHRRALGLPALSVNWGPWEGEGMAARTGGRRGWASQGTGTIPPEKGVEILGRLLRSAAVQVGVLPVRWPAFLQRFAGGRVPPLFARLAAAGIAPPAPGEGPSELMQRLREAPAGAQREVLTAYVTEQAARLLGPDRAAALDPRRPLQDFGLDSRTAVELRNALGHAVGRPLPATLLFNYPTVEALVGLLAGEVLKLDAPVPPRPERPAGSVADRALDAIEQISDEEVDRLLGAMTSPGTE